MLIRTIFLMANAADAILEVKVHRIGQDMRTFCLKPVCFSRHSRELEYGVISLLRADPKQEVVDVALLVPEAVPGAG